MEIFTFVKNIKFFSMEKEVQEIPIIESQNIQIPEIKEAAELNKKLTDFELILFNYFQEKQQVIDKMRMKIEDYLSIKPNKKEISLNPNWPFCRNGHSLYWGRMEEQFSCCICKQIMKISFWSCKTLGCEEKYCSKCYMPFLKNDKCPINHSLYPILSVFGKCDLCSKTLKLSGYLDAQC